MDFFGYQDAARRRSWMLLFYYIIAVSLLVLLTHAAVIGCFFLPKLTVGEFDAKPLIYHFFKWEPFLISASGVLIIVLGGTLWKIYRLRKGGFIVALALGGEPVMPETQDPYERRALNITEEMAIAAGVPVPTLYILNDEEGINAFAAGYTLQDAVVGITRGCAQKLSRDELQGVIAHEFSHILNSDMRLNIRLIGILQGILGLYIIGRTLLNFSPRRRYSSGYSYSDGYGSVDNRRRGGGGGGQLMAFGFALVVIGSVGALFARIIQSAISRQREFLADASAVQFTRNPDGIASALKKIGGFKTGSRLRSGHTAEASHMFFSEGLSGFFTSLFSTHPPLKTRISRLDPHFKGEFPKLSSDFQTNVGEEAISRLVSAPKEEVSHISVTPDSIINSIGTITSNSYAKAQELIWALPESVKEAAHDLYGAQAVIILLLLSPEPTLRQKELDLLETRIHSGAFSKLLEIEPFAPHIKLPQRLPLLDLAASALRRLSPEGYQQFNESLTELIQADSKLSNFEFILITILHHTVERQIFELPTRQTTFNSIELVLNEIAVLLSALANAGTDRELIATQCFDAGLEELAAKYGATHLPPSLCEPRLVAQALDKLSEASPELKKRIISACVRTMSLDGRIVVGEAELLRAICESLDCPLPVF